MRIIEWNCQGAFRTKNKEIFKLKPDLLIVPECEEEAKLQFGKLTPRPNDFFWHGETGKKGIAIFSYSKFKFRLLKVFNPNFRYVLPIEVTDGENSFLLFAIWAMDNKENPLARYIGQVWKAINYYQTILNDKTILIGDFNSNQIWDSKDRIANHTDVVNILKTHSIESLYHKQFDEEQGKESRNTFFMHRKKEKPYHIDYVFASQSIFKNGFNLTIENPEKWIDKSDHLPLVVDINDVKGMSKINDCFQEITQRQLNKLTVFTKKKFSKEIKALEALATKIENENSLQNNIKIVTNTIETLLEIDSLIAKLNENLK